jgi:hypothetical protein
LPELKRALPLERAIATIFTTFKIVATSSLLQSKNLAFSAAATAFSNLKQIIVCFLFIQKSRVQYTIDLVFAVFLPS